MTILPTVRQQIELAAGRLASDGDDDDTARAHRTRHRVTGWALAALSAAVVAVVIVAVARGHHGAAPAHPSTTAPTGGGGLSWPVLHAGQAWLFTSIEGETSAWAPPSRVNYMTLPLLSITAYARAAVAQRTVTRTWLLQSGDAVSDGHALGRPTFIGGPSERALWNADGRRPGLQLSTGASSQTSNGFGVGDRNFSYSQLLHFPLNPAEILRMFPASGADPDAQRFEAIGNAFANAPLPFSAAEELFDTLTTLPGVQRIGSAVDPLKRRGIALAVNGPTAITLLARGPGSTPRSLPVREELIFNPTTKALLASETVLAKSSPLPQLKAGYPISWTAYRSVEAVPASQAPTITPVACPGGAVRLSVGPIMSPQTGEHPHAFELTNIGTTPCTLDGYPKVSLTSDGHALRFVYRDGGAMYVTRRKPQPVTLKPNGHAYFMVAKYRCDIGTQSTATIMYIARLGLGGIATLELRNDHIDDFTYCKRGQGSPAVDPGNYIYISPFEPTVGATTAGP